MTTTMMIQAFTPLI
jgi:hypothetical protein